MVRQRLNPMTAIATLRMGPSAARIHPRTRLPLASAGEFEAIEVEQMKIDQPALWQARSRRDRWRDPAKSRLGLFGVRWLATALRIRFFPRPMRRRAKVAFDDPHGAGSVHPKRR